METNKHREEERETRESRERQGGLYKAQSVTELAPHLSVPLGGAGLDAGFEPYQHLSPAFTLSRHDVPFSLQLQADPYLSSEMMEDVKAIYANHYCAVHCKGFFEQSDSEVPCIVVRM